MQVVSRVLRQQHHPVVKQQSRMAGKMAGTAGASRWQTRCHIQAPETKDFRKRMLERSSLWQNYPEEVRRCQSGRIPCSARALFAASPLEGRRARGG